MRLKGLPMELLPCPQSSIEFETRAELLSTPSLSLSLSHNSTDVNFDGTVQLHGALHERACQSVQERVHKLVHDKRDELGMQEGLRVVQKEEAAEVQKNLQNLQRYSNIKGAQESSEQVQESLKWYKTRNESTVVQKYTHATRRVIKGLDDSTQLYQQPKYLFASPTPFYPQLAGCPLRSHRIVFIYGPQLATNVNENA